MANLYLKAVRPADLNQNTEWFMYPGVWTTYILIVFFSWLLVLFVSGCSCRDRRQPHTLPMGHVYHTCFGNEPFIMTCRGILVVLVICLAVAGAGRVNALSFVLARRYCPLLWELSGIYCFGNQIACIFSIVAMIVGSDEISQASQILNCLADMVYCSSLKGGKEDKHSNAILHKVITSAIPDVVGKKLIGLVASRDEIPDLLKAIPLERPTETPKIISVAQFRPEKVHGLQLKAFAVAIEKHPSYSS